MNYMIYKVTLVIPKHFLWCRSVFGGQVCVSILLIMCNSAVFAKSLNLVMLSQVVCCNHYHHLSDHGNILQWI